MHSIYRIVNFRNGKMYVGQTNDIAKRKYAHFSDLLRGKHKNKHLQHAYNKHGKDAFFFEILEANISSSDIDERECYWIDHFDSRESGYNIDPGGSKSKVGQSKSLIWNGVKYESAAASARVLGVPISRMLYRRQRGFTCDSDVPAVGKAGVIPCVWNGTEYESIAEAARFLGISQGNLTKRLIKGRICDADVPLQTRDCTWNGVYYPTLADASRALNKPVSTIRVHLSKGYSSDSDVENAPRKTRSAKSCIWNGIEYKSVADAAAVLGIPRATMYTRLLKGYSCDADMKEWCGDGKSCTWEGVTYPSITEAHKAIGISYKRLANSVLQSLSNEQLDEIGYPDYSIQVAKV